MADTSVTRTNGNIVIIEWDGRIPPTPYYHRLRKLTGGVRLWDDKDQSVISRRSMFVSDNEQRGIILQEGAIITASKSLARVIANLAIEYGARDVHVGEVELSPLTEMTDADKDAMNRVDDAFGRRGRPRKPINWMITCIECMDSTWVEELSYVASCPMCGGLNIITYPAKKPILYEYVIEKGGEKSLINEWLVTRFGTGRFMMPSNDTYTKSRYSASRKCVTTVKIKEDADSEVVDILRGSDFVQSLINSPEKAAELRDEVMDALDGMFASLRYVSDDDRERMRVKAIMQIMKAGYKGYVNMSSDKNNPDVIDTAGVFKPDRVRSMFYTLRDF